MLQFLRKKGNIKKIMWGLAIVIVPAFVLWGSGSAIRSRGMPEYAGEIFGRKISFRQYEQSLTACRNQALLLYGERFKSIAQYLNLEDQAWERLILLEQAKKEKIRVSDAQVVDFIEKMPLFQNQNQFDQKRYQQLLDYVFRSSPRDFEEQVREALKIGALKDKVIAPVELTDEEIKEAYQNENEKAKAGYIFFDPQQFSEQIHPSFEQLEEYYQGHKNQFKKPEQVNAQYLALYLEQNLEVVNVSEEEIKNYYEEHQDEFSITDKKGKETTKPLAEVKEQIQKKLFEDKIKAALEDKIWAISDQITEPASFEDVAKTNGLEVKETGLFGPQQVIPEVGFSYEFLQTAFNLEIGEISNVIETPKGYFILKVKEKKPPYIPDLEVVKTEVEQALIKQEAREKARLKGEQVLTELKKLMQDKALSFEKAAQELSLTLKESEEFTRSGYVSGIGQSPQFNYTAFASKPGGVSNLVSVPNGYCILSLKEVIPIDEEKFAEEKQEFSKKVLARKNQTHYRVWFNVLKSKADLVSNLEKLNADSRR